MKNLLLLLPALLFLSGCDQRAVEFARKTVDLLAEYQKRLDDQITASSAYYRQTAGLLAADDTRVNLGGLQAERNERSSELEADLREGRRSHSLYRTYLRDYAKGHAVKQQAWLSAGIDASVPYLTQLIALDSDKATVEAYGKVLKNLAEPRGLRDQIGDIKDFVDSSKQEFQTLVCNDLKTKLTALSIAPAGELPVAKAEREQSKQAFENLIKDQKCK
jgi:hypothetical protein